MLLLGLGELLESSGLLASLGELALEKARVD